MSRISLRRVHTLDEVAARRAADRIARSLERDHGIESAWHDSVLHFSAPGLDGRLELRERELSLDIRLGWALRPFRRRLEQAIEARLEGILGAPGGEISG